MHVFKEMSSDNLHGYVDPYAHVKYAMPANYSALNMQSSGSGSFLQAIQSSSSYSSSPTIASGDSTDNSSVVYSTRSHFTHYYFGPGDYCRSCRG